MLPFILASLILQTPDVKTDIVYNTAGETEVKLDFYKAVSASPKPKPLIILIHGGAWIQGERKEMAPMADVLAKNGFSVANISYRLAPKNKWPAMMDDCKAAVRFFRKNAKEYDINPLKIGAAGASAGGHLSLLLGTTDENNKEPYKGFSSRVQCVLNLFGPTDLTADFSSLVAGYIAKQVLGKNLDESDQELRDYSPINHIDKLTCPVFTIQGKADPLVPFKQAERLDAALKTVGIAHETIFIEDMKHELPIERKEVSDAVDKGLAFLRKYLMPTK